MSDYIKTKGKTLADFSGSGWLSWVQRATAYFTRRKVWDALVGENPIESGRKEERQSFETEIQRLHPDGVAMLDDRGNPVMDTTTVEYSSLESQSEYSSRCEEYFEAMALVWADIVEACGGEAGVLLRGAPANDGRAAWEALQQHYGSVSVSTTVSLLDQLLDYTPKCTIGQFVTGWKELLRKLGERSIVLDKQLESILFTRSLPAKYSNFVIHQKLQAQGMTQPHKVYEAAIDFGISNNGEDEANNGGKALWGGEQSAGGRGTKRPHGSSDQKNCYNCKKPGHLQADCRAPCGYCNKSGHRKMECNTRKRDNAGKGGGKGGRGKGGGKGGRGKGGRGGKGSQDFGGQAYYADNATELSELSKQVADMAKLQESMRAKCNEAGIALVLGSIDELGDALETISLRDTVVLKIDSGASTHYVGDDVQLTNTGSVHHTVGTARGGDAIEVKTAGVLTGAVGNIDFELSARQSDAFSHNLFSVREAVRVGHTVTFTPEGSWIVCGDGTKIPLRSTRSGWELHVETNHTGSALDVDDISPEASRTKA
jgi:hypothetical protein